MNEIRENYLYLVISEKCKITNGQHDLYSSQQHALNLNVPATEKKHTQIVNIKLDPHLDKNIIKLN